MEVMFDKLKKEINLIRVLIFLSIATLSIHLFGIIWQVLGMFSDIIIIFVTAWLFSFVLEPLVEKITHAFIASSGH